MWFENSVKYLNPFSPQPTQFPENPAGGATRRRSTGWVLRLVYSQTAAARVVLPAGRSIKRRRRLSVTFIPGWDG